MYIYVCFSEVLHFYVPRHVPEAQAVPRLHPIRDQTARVRALPKAVREVAAFRPRELEWLDAICVIRNHAG